MIKDLTGVLPALISPLRADGTVDEPAVSRLVEHVISGGVTGMLALGSTGETASLDEKARRTLLSSVVAAAAGRVPVICGVAQSHLAAARGEVEAAARLGAAAALVAPPSYYPMDQATVLAFYRQLAKGSPLPILLYNIPRRTGVGFTVAMVERLADDPKVVGIKESSKDWGLLSSVIRRTRDRISVFAGYASFFGLAALCEGAVGYIDSGTPVFGAKSLAFHKAATTGDLDTARRLQSDMEHMLTAYFGLGTFPASIKAALDLLGRPGGPTRDPIRPLDPAQREVLRKTMVAAGLIAEQARAGAA